ncbi:MAG TPA: MFS transporter, partial [Micromonosporaceae bacterium]
MVGTGAYWKLWTAAVISRLGDALRQVALPMLAVSLTADPRLIALIVVAGQLPWLLFGLLGGAVADRADRRRSMMLVDALRAVLAVGLGLGVALGMVNIWLVLVFVFLLATLGTVFDASAVAMLPAVVAPAALAQANGRLQAAMVAAGGFIGAPLGGALFVAAAAAPFLADGLSFAVAAVLALTLPAAAGRPADVDQTNRTAATVPPGPAPSVAGRTRRSLWHDAAAGLAQV